MEYEWNMEWHGMEWNGICNMNKIKNRYFVIRWGFASFYFSLRKIEKIIRIVI